MTEDFILGDSALHQRLCAITQVLGKFVASAPRPISLRQLAQGTGYAETELTALCAGLGRAALLRRHPQFADSWELACAPDQVTLEDVFRCVMSEQAEQPVGATASTPAAQPANRPQRLHHDADLLVMQAAMAINQSIFQHLRQFSLDRLKVSNTTAFPSAQTRYRVGALA